jgi:protein TonB
MGSVVRYLATVAIAAIITLSAFYLMHRLIDHDAAAAVSPPPLTSIYFGPVEIPDEPNPDPRVRPEPPERQEPPPPSRVTAQVEKIDRAIDIERTLEPAPGANRIYTGGFTGGPGGASGSASARPVAAVPPPYPREAALQGLEGWVRVAIEIDAAGRVRDVEVLEADPRGVFDQAAVQAVRRWTWKPAIIDGKPTAQRVVQELTFELDES